MRFHGCYLSIVTEPQGILLDRCRDRLVARREGLGVFLVPSDIFVKNFIETSDDIQPTETVSSDLACGLLSHSLTEDAVQNIIQIAVEWSVVGMNTDLSFKYNDLLGIPTRRRLVSENVIDIC